MEPPRKIAADFCAVFPGARCGEDDVRRVDNMLWPPDLQAVFNAERERIKADPNAAPYTDKFWRLYALNSDVEYHRANNELATARGVMRQIAEEMGEGGPGGGGAPGGGNRVVSITRTIVDPAEPVPAVE
jgi:hypothetical protein